MNVGLILKLSNQLKSFMSTPTLKFTHASSTYEWYGTHLAVQWAIRLLRDEKAYGFHMLFGHYCLRVLLF